MPIYTLQGSASPQGPEWLEMPPISTTGARSARRILKRIAERLPKSYVLLHRTKRISHPPREIEIDLFFAERKTSHIIIKKMIVDGGVITDLSNDCAGISNIAHEISERWPEGARPDEIAIMTDGRSIWFIPDNPNCPDDDWLSQIVNGSLSPAMIYTKESCLPLSNTWFDQE